MPLVATPIIREFKYGSLILPDPNPSLSAEQVRELHAAAYPELANAKVHTETSHTADGEKQTTTFTRSVGTKG